MVDKTRKRRRSQSSHWMYSERSNPDLQLGSKPHRDLVILEKRRTACQLRTSNPRPRRAADWKTGHGNRIRTKSAHWTAIKETKYSKVSEKRDAKLLGTREPTRRKSIGIESLVRGNDVR